MEQRISFQELPKGLLDGLMRTEFYLKKSALDARFVELVKYRVSQMNGCAYCLDVHYKDALHLGETDLRLHSVIAWSDCPYYTEKERAALLYAETLTDANKADVDDELFGQLTAHYTLNEIADLTLVITQTNSWNRINKAFKRTPGNHTAGQYQ